ncbi:MAG: archease [Alphaproteobacteria bacterium]
MYTLKLRRVGNSLGLTLPREALAELGVGEGDTVFLTRTPEGFALTPYDETFAAALDAFAELVAGSENGQPTEVSIELRGRDRTLLLVDWLDELLFLVEIEQFVPRHITSIELGEESLQATVAGDHGTPRPLVKGISLNGLRFEQEGGVWHGRVVFDV